MIFKEKYWDKFFHIAVFLKAFNGLWQVISGWLLFFISRDFLNSTFLRLAQHELLEDPQDRIVNFLSRQLEQISRGTQDFAAFYITLHGIINLFLAVNLYQGKLWAYKISLGFTFSMIVYQLYRFSHTHSLILIGLTIFDLCYLILTWHEYRYHTKKL